MALFASIFALLGLIIGIISYERDVKKNLVYFNYYKYLKESEEQKNAMHHDRFNDSETRAWRSMIFLTSMISFVLLCLRNWYRK